jgi:HEAT repeat protein
MPARRHFRLSAWRWAWPTLLFVSCYAHAATPEVSRLLAEFQAEPVFWKQVEIADLLVRSATPADVSSLAPGLAHADRRIRGNVAYAFARVGDPRGLATIEAILADYSDDRRVEWQGGSLISERSVEDAMERHLRSPGALRAQIKADRYYAVHLLGRLRDRRAVSTLVPFLADDDINYNVAWALGEIGDARATLPLIAALSSPSALVRTSAIHALEKLRAMEALPALTALFDDAALPSAGDRVPVGVAALKAVKTIRNSGARR